MAYAHNTLENRGGDASGQGENAPSLFEVLANLSQPLLAENPGPNKPHPSANRNLINLLLIFVRILNAGAL
jgi:hypothetical protein